MSVFKKILVFLAASSLSFLLFATAMSTSVVSTFKPDNLKRLLDEGKIYDNIVQGIIDEGKKVKTDESQDPNAPKEEDPLDDPAVQEVVKQTFTPAYIKQTAETIIDGTTPWLEGKIAKPSFSVDLVSIKETFANNLGVYATQRYAALPACAAGQIPDTSDILKVACKPAGYDPRQRSKKQSMSLRMMTSS